MWIERPLSDLATITSGGTPAREVAAYWDGEIPWVTPSDITACRTNVLRETKEQITAKGLAESAARLVPAQSVLLTSRATVGEARMAGTQLCTNQGFKALTAKQGVDPWFLFYQVQRCRSEFERYAAGSTFLEISKRDTERVPLKHPTDIRDQQRIAAILTRVDNAIEATEALIEKHRQIKAGLMQDLFTHGIGSSRTSRVAGGTHAFQHTRLGVLPTGWSVLTLQRCLGEGASNGIYKPPHLIGRGTLLIGQTALTEDRSVDSSLARRAIATQEEIRRFGLAAGDILVARVFATVQGVGRPALVPELGEPAVFESNMMRLRVAESIIRPRLLFEWLQSDASRRYIEGRANASNQVSVNQGVLYPLPVPVPPPDEQDRMVACIEAADRARAAEMRTLRKLRMQMQGMMQDLLTGKVRVSMPKTEAVA